MEDFKRKLSTDRMMAEEFKKKILLSGFDVDMDKGSRGVDNENVDMFDDGDLFGVAKWTILQFDWGDEDSAVAKGSGVVHFEEDNAIVHPAEMVVVEGSGGFELDGESVKVKKAVRGSGSISFEFDENNNIINALGEDELQGVNLSERSIDGETLELALLAEFNPSEGHIHLSELYKSLYPTFFQVNSDQLLSEGADIAEFLGSVAEIENALGEEFERLDKLDELNQSLIKLKKELEE